MERLNVGVEAVGDKGGLGTWLAGMNYSILGTVKLDIGFTSDFDLDAKSVMSGLHCEF
jgi:hypothetical protein